MASLIPGYEYDIFISYRQKDNKYDGWITEFVTNLKKELEATFKEDISVYFDINPHDGLLETHDVEASLKDKLKCLVFIPIISRTYCDPKSFAWEHEFKAFINQASLDQFGLKVKLPKGNVASRVLPVRIHDLDPDDIKLLESVTGGMVRGIEFIYKEPGVNKPLKEADDDRRNLNNTKYRIQINKVANAIKEIISGLQSDPSALVKERIQLKERDPEAKEVKKDEKTKTDWKHINIRKVKPIYGWLITALIVTGILIYPRIFERDSLEKIRSAGGRITVAVMPFQNMTNDTTWNIWQEGIQNELINILTNSEELMVRQSESISYLLKNKGLKNYASLTPSIATSVSKKLDANVSVSGTIKQAGSTLRVNAQLTDPKTEEPFKSFQIDGTAENILSIIDSLSTLVRNSLIITKLEKGLTPDYKHLVSTKSAEAFRYFIYGDKAYSAEDFPAAIKFYLQALAIDSNFYPAAVSLSWAYWGPSYIAGCNYEEARRWCLKLYEKRDKLPLQDRIQVNYLYSNMFETPYECITSLKQLKEFDDQAPMPYYNLSIFYFILGQNDKAIAESEKALEIYHKWGAKPYWIHNYTILGMAYHKAGQYEKEKQLFKRAEQDFPNNLRIIKNQTILALSEGDTVEANKYINKYRSSLKENNVTEADIILELAIANSDAGVMDKAEEYYKECLALAPENNDVKFLLAYFLIDKDRNIDKGLELIDTALKADQDNYLYLECKGWGLYKKGRFEESRDILQRSWDLRRKYGEYDHQAFLHLEAAKKAVARQKN